MARKRSRPDTRKQVKPAARWGAYVLMGVLLMVVAAGAAAQLLAAPPSPNSAATASTASPATNVAGSNNTSGAGSSARTLYVYGDQLRPLVEETNGVQTLNIYGPGGQIIAQVVRDGQGGQEVRYLLADHLGSTRAVLDANGNAVARFEYGPYGETTAAGTAAAEVRYRYTGHPYDAAQGVYETPARGYDPTLGRFLSVDPQRQGASPYVYAANNPVGYVDTTGGVVEVPFFVHLGMPMNKSERLSSLGRSVLTEFGMIAEQQPVHASIFQSKEGWVTSSAEHTVNRLLYGTQTTATPREYRYNDKMYWIIGDDPNGTVELNRLSQGLEALRRTSLLKGGPRIANKIVLIDTTKDGVKGLKIRQALIDVGERPRLVRATMVLGTDRFGRDFAKNLVSGGYEFTPDNFSAVVNKYRRLDVRFPSVSTKPESEGATALQSSGATAGQKHKTQSPELGVESDPKRSTNFDFRSAATFHESSIPLEELFMPLEEP